MTSFNLWDTLKASSPNTDSSGVRAYYIHEFGGDIIRSTAMAMMVITVT